MNVPTIVSNTYSENERRGMMMKSYPPLHIIKEGALGFSPPMLSF